MRVQVVVLFFLKKKTGVLYLKAYRHLDCNAYELITLTTDNLFIA